MHCQFEQRHLKLSAYLSFHGERNWEWLELTLALGVTATSQAFETGLASNLNQFFQIGNTTQRIPAII